ncbi:uncharacterized protein LOC143342721 [Colletes latitarsis]|uniref:uncharacterized protein LOC143342721 n=1 Tax=Colletes latitarsis TaxID=2605962 RepID=UPI0040372668
MSMHCRWEKRKVQANEDETNEPNDFPLSQLRIDPDHGILSPSSVHYFNVTAECTDLQPNYYSSVLQLYVEDIPLAAIPKKLQLHVKECTTKRRKCLISVDIWVADVEVCVQHMKDDEKETFEELFESLTETPSDHEYSFDDDQTKTSDYTDDSEEYKSTRRLITDELFSHYDVVNLKRFESLLWERIISMGIIRPTRLVIL